MENVVRAAVRSLSPLHSVAFIAWRRMNATHDALVRSDRRGRLRYAAEQKAAILEAYAQSGLSDPKFVAPREGRGAERTGLEGVENLALVLGGVTGAAGAVALDDWAGGRIGECFHTPSRYRNQAAQR
jgi:hypothetical protein